MGAPAYEKTKLWSERSLAESLSKVCRYANWFSSEISSENWF